MRLIEYMKERDITDERMAELVGDCTVFAIRKWKYGERMPRRKQLARLREVTEGAVTANDFAGEASNEAA